MMLKRVNLWFAAQKGEHWDGNYCFMILVTSTWLIQKLYNKLLFSIAVCFPCSQRITR